jgi:hypothetical protein
MTYRGMSLTLMKVVRLKVQFSRRLKRRMAETVDGLECLWMMIAEYTEIVLAWGKALVYSNESTAGCNFGGNSRAKKIEVAQCSQNNTENVISQVVVECWD